MTVKIGEHKEGIKILALAIVCSTLLLYGMYQTKSCIATPPAEIAVYQDGHGEYIELLAGGETYKIRVEKKE